MKEESSQSLYHHATGTLADTWLDVSTNWSIEQTGLGPSGETGPVL